MSNKPKKTSPFEAWFRKTYDIWRLSKRQKRVLHIAKTIVERGNDSGLRERIMLEWLIGQRTALDYINNAKLLVKWFKKDA